MHSAATGRAGVPPTPTPRSRQPATSNTLPAATTLPQASNSKRLAQTAAAAAGGSVLRQPCCSEQQQQQCTCAVVIVDHGSRRKASNDMLLEFCQLYQQMTQHPIVEPAHMEIAEPSIAQAIGRCVEAGAGRVVVAPYFLSKGRHIQDDIPALVAAAQEQYPGISCSIAEPIGIEPLMVRIIQSRVEAALHKDCPAAAQLAAASAGNSPEAAAEEVLATAAVGAAQQQ